MDIFLRKTLKTVHFLNNSLLSFSFLRSSPLSHFFQNKAEIFRKESSSSNDLFDTEDGLDPDYQWFSRIKLEVHKTFEIAEKTEKNSYDKTIKKSSQIEDLTYDKTLNLLLYIGISSQRRFSFQKSQRLMMNSLKKLQKTPEFLNFLQPFSEKSSDFSTFSQREVEFLRKTWPNLIIGCNNLQILDLNLLRKFITFFSIHKGQIIANCLFSIHTMLSLVWALLNYEVSKCEEITLFLKESMDYIWLNREKFDRITLLRFIWLCSFYGRFDKECEEVAWKRFTEEFAKFGYFSYNYKNSNNLLQILLNNFPEITDDFFDKDLRYDGEKCVKSAENNKLKAFLPFFLPICYNSYIISKFNENGDKKIAIFGSNRKEMPNFLIVKDNISNKSGIFEENVCKTLDDLEIKYRRNVRIGIYEVDILIEPDLALEINGDMHSLYTVEGERYKRNLRFSMKMK